MLVVFKVDHWPDKTFFTLLFNIKINKTPQITKTDLRKKVLV